MAITSISTNYTNRTADISLFPTQSLPLTPVPLQFSAFPKAISGVLKGSQNYIKTLLTPRGYYKSNPTYGTNLVSRIKSGGLRYPGDLYHLFAIENGSALAYIRSNETSSMPADERIGSVELDSFSVTYTQVTMHVVYSSASTENDSLLLPVQLNL